jgi:hypothetical protein
LFKDRCKNAGTQIFSCGFASSYTVVNSSVHMFPT